MKKLNTSFSTLIIHLLFGVLFIYALVYYKERLFSDSGYYIYRVVDEHFFAIGLNRFILIFSQLLPVIAVNIGLSLKTILISYSINHVLFFYVLFLISHYHYKNKYAGILFVLIQILGIQSGFFTPMFELYYGVGFLVLFDVILYRDEHKPMDYALLMLQAFIILTSHPVTYFLMLFVLVFHFIKYKWKYKWYYIVAIAMIAGVMVFKNYTQTEYEKGKTNTIVYMLQHGVYDMEYIKSLAAFLFQYYKELLIIAIITVVYFIIKREWIKSGIFLLSFLFFITLINLSYYGFEHSRYQEQGYFPLSFVVGYVFVYYVLKSLSSTKEMLVYGCVLILLVCRFAAIKSEGVNYTYRVNVMEEMISKCQLLKGNKFVVNVRDIVPKDGISTSWSYPMETMLLSGMDGKQKTVTICTDDDMTTDGNDKKIKATQYIMRCWDIKEDKSVNKDYFHIEDGEYVYLNGQLISP